MAETLATEGKVPFSVPNITKPCYTFYKVFGDLKDTSNRTPLVVLHGGPGAGHDYLLPLAELLARYSIPVIFYDQIGNGQSTHLQETAGDETLWQESLFINELDNLVDHLGLRDRGFDLLGQSWGGMLGSAYAAKQPKGLHRIILANAPASMALWMKSARILKEQLPKDLQKVIDDAEDKGDFESPEYEAAVEVYYKKHLCILEPWPAPEVAAALRWLTEDSTVYGTMNGPSEMTITGTLKSWSIIDRLQDIQTPALLFNGEHDEAQDLVMAPYFEGLSKVKWVTVQNSSHFTHVEQKEKVLKLVGEFLTQG